MEIRDLRDGDSDGLRDVARSSLRESYGDFVPEESIDALVDEWYAAERLGTRRDDESSVFKIAEEDDEIVGFAEGDILDEEAAVGELHWLHVAPGERGEGVGLQLLGHLQDTFEDLGARVMRGLVLSGNEGGVAFYDDHGFEEVDRRTSVLEGDDFEEVVFEKLLAGKADDQVIEEIDGPDDRELFVSFSDAERGVSSPFYAVYTERDLEDRYGWFCGECDSIDTAMDSDGRVVCNECGNKRKATRWDGSYL